MKFKLTTAFPGLRSLFLPPLLGFFLLSATARAQQQFNPSTLQPQAPPVESTSQLYMTNSFQLFNRQPAATAPAPYEPFQWDQFVLRPHADYQYIDAYHVLAAPSNLVDTTIQRISPGLLFNLGPHWALDYTLTLGLYSNTNFGTEVDHSITLTGQTVYGDWIFGFLQSVLLTSTPLVEFGGQQDQQYYNTSVTGHHEVSPRVSIDLSLNQNIQVFSGNGFENMHSWSTIDWLNYAPQSHISFGIGPGLGYNNAVYGPDSLFQQIQARVNWRLTDILSLQVSGGVVETEFLGSQGNGDLFSPIYSGSLQLQPFSQTEISVYASRYVSPSVLVGEYTEGTTFGASFGQRFLGQFYFSVDAGYSNQKYVASAITVPVLINTNTIAFETLNEGRTDKLYSLSCRLGHSFLQRGNISIFYAYSSDNSSFGGYSFASNQFGAEVSYSF
ncbi:MAG TPA: hypothetical protein VMF08_16600 [Candidatus Sulfotelmatobacter sp.]|nr:hypothetical protein [Candidatus Sulfotelmatobacter sp.]